MTVGKGEKGGQSVTVIDRSQEEAAITATVTARVKPQRRGSRGYRGQQNEKERKQEDIAGESLVTAIAWRSEAWI